MFPSSQNSGSSVLNGADETISVSPLLAKPGGSGGSVTEIVVRV